jgi:hypothetical protein
MEIGIRPARKVFLYREKSASTGDLYTALAQATLAFLPIEKDTDGEFGRYASLPSLQKSTKLQCAEVGLVFTGETTPIDGVIHLTSVLAHGPSDQWVSSTVGISMGNDIRRTLADIGWWRRTHYALLLNLTAEAEGEPLPPSPSSLEGENEESQPAASNGDWLIQQQLAVDAISTATTVARINKILARVRDKISAGGMNPHCLGVLESLAQQRFENIAAERNPE